MKQKDIALIVAVVIISGTVSFLLSKVLFGVPKDRQTKVEVVQAINDSFPPPDTRYFNSDAIDPTQKIIIGDTQNTQPFNTQNGQ